MQSATVLIACYGVVLIIGSVALHRRGRRIERTATGTDADDWTATTLPRLHTAVALVAAGAAALVPVVVLIAVRPQVTEALVLALTSAVALGALVLLARSGHSAVRSARSIPPDAPQAYKTHKPH